MTIAAAHREVGQMDISKEAVAIDEGWLYGVADNDPQSPALVIVRRLRALSARVSELESTNATTVADSVTCVHLTAEMAANCPRCNPTLNTITPGLDPDTLSEWRQRVWNEAIEAAISAAKEVQEHCLHQHGNGAPLSAIDRDIRLDWLNRSRGAEKAADAIEALKEDGKC